MNDPKNSKINWTALATQLITIALIAGWIPNEYSTPVLAIVGIVMPGIVQVFRTWYTGPRQRGVAGWVFVLVTLFALILVVGLHVGLR